METKKSMDLGFPSSSTMRRISGDDDNSNMYDVFINFRGEDTRTSLTNHIYTALSREHIKAFIDYKDVRRGDDISGSILKAIETSQLYLVIFSPDYGSSPWCLIELENILFCSRKDRKKVIPVFYKVDPTHIRYQTGSFGINFATKHKDETEMVLKWRAALKEAADLSGLHLDDNKRESEFIHDIVAAILRELKPMLPLSNTPKVLVGINQHIEKIERLLCMNSEVICRVGIWGMGGIGKTTIAKSVFARIGRKFDGYYFFEDIRGEIARHGKGFFWSKFCSEGLIGKKVFIVYDGVDDLTFLQIPELEVLNHLLARGSKILMTSRDNHVLKKLNVDEVYKVVGLRDDEALKLFSLMAFKNEFPPMRYFELCTRVVRSAQGNALALRVLGSHFTDKDDESYWHSELEKIEQSMSFEVDVISKMVNLPRHGQNDDKDVRLSDTQGMTFFQWMTRVFRSSNKEVQLPLPHLRYLCWKEFPLKSLPSGRVRPSFSDSMRALQFLTLSGSSIKCLPESVFGLANLRVFFAEDCQLCELPENPRSPLLEVLFLRGNWSLRKIPSSFFDGMQAVKFLDMSMTGIKSLPVSALSLLRLEWLWLSHCELCNLPDHPNWPVLEGLLLDGNRELRAIPPSFFDCMPALRMLDLSLTGIKSLPNSPFSLPELRSLFLIDCKLCKLPENLMFPKLQELSLRGNRQLRMIPPTFFENMPALLDLCLSKTSIKYLPDSLFCLKQLEFVHLRDCDLLTTLSPRIGELKCLKDLDLEGTEIMHLPKEVKELVYLKGLRVSFCELPSYMREKHSEQLIYPGTLSSLSELEELCIDVSPEDERWNQCVEVTVSELSKLLSLKALHLYVPRTTFLSCFQWRKLESFDIKVGHHANRMMPRLPSDAEIELQKYDRRLTYVNGDGESKEINLLLEFTEALFLDRHSTIYALSQFEGLNDSLKCCVAGECNQVQVLFHGDQMNYLGLEYLHVYYMKSLKSILEGVVIPYALSSLKSLTLRTCPELTTVFTPALVAGLMRLEELTMIDCPLVTNLVSSTNDVRHFTFVNDHFIPTLKRISLHDLPELTAILDLSLSPNLSWISIYHCPNLKTLPINKLKNTDLKKIEGETNWWKALEWGCYRRNVTEQR